MTLVKFTIHFVSNCLLSASALTRHLMGWRKRRGAGERGGGGRGERKEEEQKLLAAWRDERDTVLLVPRQIRLASVSKHRWLMYRVQ